VTHYTRTDDAQALITYYTHIGDITLTGRYLTGYIH